MNVTDLKIIHSRIDELRDIGHALADLGLHFDITGNSAMADRLHMTSGDILGAAKEINDAIGRSLMGDMHEGQPLSHNMVMAAMAGIIMEQKAGDET